jgi:ribonuclease P protein component
MDPRGREPPRRGRGVAPRVVASGPAGWGRLVASVAFERILGRPASSRTPHFALHGELSTENAAPAPDPVDKPVFPVHGSPSRALGLVVPKRHARRAVTRTLLKRQIRAVARSTGADLADGLWVVRLRSPFDRAQFPSAASDALRRTARRELEQLFGHRALARRPDAAVAEAPPP